MRALCSLEPCWSPCSELLKCYMRLGWPGAWKLTLWVSPLPTRMPHCPTGLPLQNTRSKIELLRMLRGRQWSMKSVWGASECGTLQLLSSHTHDAVSGWSRPPHPTAAVLTEPFTVAPQEDHSHLDFVKGLSSYSAQAAGRISLNCRSDSTTCLHTSLQEPHLPLA